MVTGAAGRCASGTWCSRTVRSVSPVARTRPSALNATAVTAPGGPVSQVAYGVAKVLSTLPRASGVDARRYAARPSWAAGAGSTARSAAARSVARCEPTVSRCWSAVRRARTARATVVVASTSSMPGAPTPRGRDRVRRSTPARSAACAARSASRNSRSDAAIAVRSSPSAGRGWCRGTTPPAPAPTPPRPRAASVSRRAVRVRSGWPHGLAQPAAQPRPAANQRLVGQLHPSWQSVKDSSNCSTTSTSSRWLSPSSQARRRPQPYRTALRQRPCPRRQDHHRRPRGLPQSWHGQAESRSRKSAAPCTGSRADLGLRPRTHLAQQLGRLLPALAPLLGVPGAGAYVGRRHRRRGSRCPDAAEERGEME